MAHNLYFLCRLNRYSKMHKILFIDDDDDFRDALTGILESAGYEVINLKGSETLDLVLQNNKFDIAIVDYFLPMENGIEIIKRIRKSKKAEKIKILMISSHENIRPLIKTNGIDNFLPKPFEPEKLISTIKEIL